MLKKLKLIVVYLFIINLPLSAQIAGEGGMPGGIFRFGITAREIALRDAAFILTRGIETVHLNPASMSTSDFAFLISNQRMPYSRTCFNYLSGMLDILSHRGTLYLGYISMGNMDLVQYNDSGYKVNTFSYRNNAMAAALSYIVDMETHSSIGLGFKYAWGGFTDGFIKKLHEFNADIAYSVFLTKNINFSCGLRLFKQGNKLFRNNNNPIYGEILMGASILTLPISNKVWMTPGLVLTLPRNLEYGQWLTKRYYIGIDINTIYGFGGSLSIGSSGKCDNIDFGASISIDLVSLHCSGGFRPQKEFQEKRKLFEFGYEWGNRKTDVYPVCYDNTATELDTLLKGKIRYDALKELKTKELLCKMSNRDWLNLAEVSFIHARKLIFKNSAKHKQELKKAKNLYEKALKGEHDEFDRINIIHYLQTCCFLGRTTENDSILNEVFNKFEGKITSFIESDTTILTDNVDSHVFRMHCMLTLMNLKLDTTSYKNYISKINSPKMKMYAYWTWLDKLVKSDSVSKKNIEMVLDSLFSLWKYWSESTNKKTVPELLLYKKEPGIVDYLERHLNKNGGTEIDSALLNRFEYKKRFFQ